MSVTKDAKSLLDKAFGRGQLSRDGVNYAVRCPACTDARMEKKKLVVRLDDGRFHCWVCETKGSNIVAFIAKFRPDLVDGIQRIKFDKRDAKREEKQEVVLPPGAVLLGIYKRALDPDINAAINYLMRRGLDRRDMMRWRMLTCSAGRFRRRIVIPSFDCDGNPNYFVARTIDPDAKIKYQNAKVSKENIIFNEIDIDWKKEITLVEGPFDAIKCPENAVPILGSSLSTRSELLKMLMRHQTSCIVSLDPDMKHKAFKLADQLVSFGCQVRVAFAPSGSDLGDLTKKEVSRVLSYAKPYTDVMRISHKIGEIKSGSLL